MPWREAKQVRGLDVAVDDALVVSDFQDGEQVNADRHDLGQGQGATRGDARLLQRLAFEQLGDEERTAVVVSPPSNTSSTAVCATLLAILASRRKRTRADS